MITRNGRDVAMLVPTVEGRRPHPDGTEPAGVLDFAPLAADPADPST